NLCFDGTSCYMAGEAVIRLTPAAYASVKPDPAPTDTGVPELDRVNASLKVTSFTQLARPGPGDDPTEDLFRWYVADFPGSVPEALAAYLSTGVVELAESDGIVVPASASADPCMHGGLNPWPPALPPRPGGPQVTPPLPQTLTGPEGSRPPPRTLAQRVHLSKRGATWRARKALRKRYGRRYTRAASRRIRCARTGASFRCSYRFHRRPSAWRGTIIVADAAAGITATVFPR
ncbi:MAG: hypothetical protein M3082_16155, partial [Candidatus Dormibacteraeota bacterium]|nr:hypothetical protein [Candidatus Dormibacteraeota bacterium]